MTPRSTIEQACGRALRAHPEKKYVLIRDFVDTFSAFEGMWWKRFKQYQDWGFKVHEKDILLDQLVQKHPHMQPLIKSSPETVASTVQVVTFKELAQDRNDKAEKEQTEKEDRNIVFLPIRL